MMQWLRLALVAGALTLGALVPGGVVAQETLDQVESLMDEARYAEARAMLQQWWTEAAPTAPRAPLQRGLWLRALLTVDPVMAEMDYRRLVVEFPGGEWSDDALLRLARGAELMGDLGAARRYLDILVQDYPGSPHRVEARALRQRLVDAPADPAPTDPVRADAATADTATADSVLPATVPDPQPDRMEPPSEESVGPYAVQLGAFSALEGARTLAARARDLGLEVRLVRVEGSELLRVRLGAFTTAQAAEAEVARIRALGLEALVSTDRTREQPVGGVEQAL